MKKKNGTPIKISLLGLPLAVIKVCAIPIRLALTYLSWIPF